MRAKPKHNTTRSRQKYGERSWTEGKTKKNVETYSKPNEIILQITKRL